MLSQTNVVTKYQRCLAFWTDNGAEQPAQICAALKIRLTENQDLRHNTISGIAQMTGQLIWLGHKRFAQLLSTHNLTPPQYFTLVSLFHQDRARSMHILAEITHQDGATVTGIVDRLVKLGYVSRQRGEDDRRKVYVTLEEAGRLVVEQVRQVHHENWQRAFSALNQDDLEEMLRILTTVKQAWEPVSQSTDQAAAETNES